MTEGATIAALLSIAPSILAPAKFDDHKLEAETLLAGLLHARRSELYLRRNETVAADLSDRFFEALRRRARREPVAYILGDCWFSGVTLFVDRRVLIPRPETELLVKEVTGLIENWKWQSPRILDIGTGSGAISIALAKKFPGASVVALDRSSEALELAQKNAQFEKVDGWIQFVLSDVYEGLSGENRNDFDIIVSNPPYVSTSELESLEPDLAYEPRIALDGGPDGLSVIDRIVAGAGAWLRSPGVLALEIGSTQGMAVGERLAEKGFLDVGIKPDWNGHHRIVTGVLSGPI